MFGSAILNKAYSCIPEKSRFLYFAPDTPELLYVRDKPAPHQKISQQTCDPNQVEVKNPRTLGRQIPIKDISSVTAEPTRGWDETAATAKIVFAGFAATWRNLMMSIRGLPGLLFAVACLIASLASSSGQSLYDGSLGLPAGQGWTYFGTGGTQTPTNNGVQLDTSAANSFQAGYSRTTGPLNRTNGFTLLFTARMLAEAHANNNRAGFSVIVLADDKRGLELAFWTNTIFAQADSPLFTHAEDTNFSTTAAVDYALTFHPTNYVLSANGTRILSGAVRDYTAFSGFPNPYSSTDFLFFGDDTTSAGGAVILSKVVLIPAPQLVAVSSKLITWTGVAHQTYTVQSSSNLSSWAGESSVTSATGNFSFTNTSNTSPRFFRVVYP